MSAVSVAGMAGVVGDVVRGVMVDVEATVSVLMAVRVGSSRFRVDVVGIPVLVKLSLVAVEGDGAWSYR